MASPVPSPSYVVPGGATDGHAVNIVDDAHHGLRNRRHRRRHLQTVRGPSSQPVDVETLLERGADDGVGEAEGAIERLAGAPTDEGLGLRDSGLLRMRALLAQAHGDEAACRDYRDRYRAMATSLGFEGHMKWAEAMP